MPRPPAHEDAAETSAASLRLRPPVTAVAWAWSVPVETASERLILAGLAMHADPYGCTIIGQQTLARLCGLSARTVRTGLRALTDRGVVGRIPRMTRHGGRTTDAVLLVGWPKRKALPDKGYPRFGRRVVETLDTRLARLAAARQRRCCRGARQRLPRKNKDP